MGKYVMSKNYDISHNGVNIKEVTIDSLSKLGHFREHKDTINNYARTTDINIIIL